MGHVDAPMPDPTAVMAALNRAAHLVLDPAPNVFVDDVGLRLANVPAVLRSTGFDVPEGHNEVRPDGWLFSPRALEWFRGWRGTFVARARFVEELVLDRVERGVNQLVLLGAGLDTLALRRADLVDRLHVFEVDQPATQEWKQRRIRELFGFVPSNLTFAPIDFETTGSWLDALENVGFHVDRPSLVVSTGVTQYISEDALAATMSDVATLARGTSFACTFVLPAGSILAVERELRAVTEQRATERGEPWISFYEPAEILGMARAARFGAVEHVSAESWDEAWFQNRADDLHPSSSEHAIVAHR
jgi:methyltransferase (TIGR00027 family)